MATDDNIQQTPPNPPAPTGGDDKTPPPAPDDNGKGGAPDDEQVSISKKELDALQKSQKDLLSQRDKANNDNSGSDAFVQQLAQERHIDQFLKDNAEDFPDVTRDDLMHVGDPDVLKDEAGRIQNRYKEVTQKNLKNLQIADQPNLTAAEKAAQLKKLRDNPDDDSFGKMVNLQLAK